MDFKRLLHLNSYEWWRNHRKVVTYGGFLLIFGIYLFPIIREASYKNRCIILAQKELMNLTRSKVLKPKEESFVAAYQICNHRS
tara:strand:- start:1425 stop:1676 length:252 start_codon:yes stop_codon:yes gene_type:complete